MTSAPDAVIAFGHAQDLGGGQLHPHPPPDRQRGALQGRPEAGPGRRRATAATHARYRASSAVASSRRSTSTPVTRLSDVALRQVASQRVPPGVDADPQHGHPPKSDGTGIVERLPQDATHLLPAVRPANLDQQVVGPLQAGYRPDRRRYRFDGGQSHRQGANAPSTSGSLGASWAMLSISAEPAAASQRRSSRPLPALWASATATALGAFWGGNSAINDRTRVLVESQTSTQLSSPKPADPGASGTAHRALPPTTQHPTEGHRRQSFADKVARPPGTRQR
jgi:hypothetical protein